MSEYREIFISMAKRFPFALPFFYLGIAAKLGFFSPFSILIGAIIMAKPLARLFAEPWGALFFSNKRFDRPQPIYGIPEARRQEGNYEEAMAGFAKIAGEYDDQVRAYVSMIDVAIVNLKDEARAETIYREGITKLTKQEDREALAGMFSAIRTRIVSDRDGVPDRAPVSGERRA